MTVAAAFASQQQSPSLPRRRVCGLRAEPYLVVREDERVGNDYVLAAPGGEDYDFGDVVGRQRLDALVYGVGFGLVAVEADDGEFLLLLAACSCHALCSIFLFFLSFFFWGGGWVPRTVST